MSPLAGVCRFTEVSNLNHVVCMLVKFPRVVVQFYLKTWKNFSKTYYIRVLRLGYSLYFGYKDLFVNRTCSEKLQHI